MPLQGGYPGKLGAPVSGFRTKAPSGPAPRPDGSSPLGSPGTRTASASPRAGVVIQGSTRPTSTKTSGKPAKG